MYECGNSLEHAQYVLRRMKKFREAAQIFKHMPAGEDEEIRKSHEIHSRSGFKTGEKTRQNSH